MSNHNGEKSLESWIWEAACSIRGEQDAPKYKDYILPLIFVKRLCDVFDDEVERIAEKVESKTKALKLIEKDHKIVRFYLPMRAKNVETDDTWSIIRTLTDKVGESLTTAMRQIAEHNPRIKGIIDRVDFNATTHGQRDISDEGLSRLIERISMKRLGLNNVEPDIIGRSYEYLIRKFAEGGGQSAGEFYTPKEVGVIMARILDPEAGMSVYDPCCGSAGLLIKCQLVLQEKMATKGEKRYAPLDLCGQEFIGSTWAMANMNMVIHDMQGTLEIGDAMTQPKFKEGNRLKRFDLVTANPMWSQSFPLSVYENDEYDRFRYGVPLPSNADWGWIQHMLASLKPNGRMAVVLDTSAATRGSGTTQIDKEKEIRRKIIEKDLIEAVILLPENLFYNTPNAGIIVILNQKKKHPKEILMMDATDCFIKVRPKNVLSEAYAEMIVETFLKWESKKNFSRSIPLEEVGRRENDYNILPTRYVERELPKDWDESIEKIFVGSKETLKKTLIAHFFVQKDSASQKVKKGLVKSKIGLIPKGWEVKKLGEILDNSNERLRDLGGEAVPVLSLTKDYGLIMQDQRFSERVAIEDTSNYKVVRRGWIAYNPMVIWEGAIHALHDFDIGVVSPAYEVWVPDANIDYRLLDYLLKSPRVLNEYRRLASGGVKRRRIVSETDFRNIPIAIPDAKTMKSIKGIIDDLTGDLDRDIANLTKKAMAKLAY